MAVGRVMGLDVGEARIGVAVSDPLGMIASGREVIDARTPAKALDQIAAIVRDEEVVRIVAGMPLDRQGQRGHQAQKVEAFLEDLRNVVEIDVVTFDERFTSAGAHRVLDEAGVSSRKRKGKVDKIAAQQILQTYLDRESRTGGA